MAAGGYPDSYAKGELITGLDNDLNSTKVFHAGTKFENEHVETSGGRVLCIVALGDSVTEAQALAYQRGKKIHWDKVYYRDDIGHRAIARES